MNEGKENREEGLRIKRSIDEFYADRTEENLLEVMNVMMDSVIWVPCHISKEDSDKTGSEDARLVPDILQKEDEYFLPVFSGTEEMGEYGNGREKQQESFIEAIEVARNNHTYKLSGIVVNAFTTPFSLSWELLNVIEESANLQ